MKNAPTMAPGETVKLSFSAFDCDFSKIKVFAMDGQNMMKPLCETYEMPGTKDPSMLSYVESDPKVSAVLTNTTSASITPAVILSKRKGGKLVYTEIKYVKQLAKGEQTIIEFAPDSHEYDEMKLIVIESFDTMRPLCEAYDF